MKDVAARDSEQENTQILYMFGACAAAFLAYLNVLQNQFVYDDMYQVVENVWIRNVRFIPEVFIKGVWSFRGNNSSNYYRPMMHIFYMGAYYLSGASPFAFHLINFLFHIAVTLLVFVLASHVVKRFSASTSDFPAFLAALLFATHPIHTEAVAWIACLPEVSCTFFFLLSLLLYVRALKLDPMPTLSYWVSAAMYALAVYSKEPGLMLPLILVVYEFTITEKRPVVKECFIRLLPFFVVSSIYILMRSHALGNVAPTRNYQSLTRYELVLNVFPLLANYFEKLILPINLNAFHVFYPVRYALDPRFIVSFVVTTIYIACAIISWKKNKTVFFAQILLLMPLLPVLYVPFLAKNTFAERYLYLPSVGFVLLIALGISWLQNIRSRIPIVVCSALLCLVAVVFLMGTISRNKIWHDNYSLFADTVAKSPDDETARLNLGNALYLKGRTQEAAEQYRIATMINPLNDKAYSNLGAILLQEGSPQKAIGYFEQALTIDPTQLEAHNNLGVAFYRTGQYDQASKQFKIALQLNPNYVDAHLNLGHNHFAAGLTERAIEEYRICIKLKPDYAPAHSALASGYEVQGHVDQALAEYQIALRLDPNSLVAHNSIGNLYGRLGMPDQAIEHFKIAMRLDPTNNLYRINLDKAYALKANKEKRQ